MTITTAEIKEKLTEEWAAAGAIGVPDFPITPDVLGLLHFLGIITIGHDGVAASLGPYE